MNSNMHAVNLMPIHLRFPNQRIIRLLTICLLVLGGNLTAATLRFLPWDDATAARRIALQSGSSLTEVTGLHPLRRSPPFGLARDAELRVVALDRKDPEGKPVTVPLNMDAGMKSPLVLILPDPKSPSGLRAFLVDDNAEAFRWGGIRFINATGRPFLVQHGQVVKPLPESWTPTDIQPDRTARNAMVRIAEQTDPKNILYSGIWEHSPDVRKLVFVVPGADRSSVDTKIIPEDRRATEEGDPTR